MASEPVRWDGGIIYAARQVVSREKAVVFMADALADEREIHETLTKIIRGEPIGAIDDSPKYKDVISACKLLQDRFTEEKKMLMGAGGRSIILQMQQGSNSGSICESKPVAQLGCATSQQSHALKELSDSIMRIGRMDSSDDAFSPSSGDDSIFDLIESDTTANTSDEEDDEDGPGY